MASNLVGGKGPGIWPWLMGVEGPGIEPCLIDLSPGGELDLSLTFPGDPVVAWVPAILNMAKNSVALFWPSSPIRAS